MTYARFEDLPVWRDGLELARFADALCRTESFKGERDYRSQLQRAALSVSNNIAEGFERGTTPELLTFLYIARGSAGEVRSMCYFLESLSHFGNLKSEISNLKSIAEKTARQLRAWADKLQNSPITGQRYLNTRVRAQTQSEKERTEFDQRIRAGLAQSSDPRIAKIYADKKTFQI